MASSYANILATKLASLTIFSFAVCCSATSHAQDVAAPATPAVGTPQVLQVGVVGGIAIDAESLLNRGSQRIDAQSMARISASLKTADTNINRSSAMRMVSLKALNRQITSCVESGKQIPVEVQFMAGLQRIEYLIVDRQNNDLVIAGPGEGLTTDVMGNVVGRVSGTPAIHLEDFLVAMRTVDNARQGRGISVSMDPTAQGVKNLRSFFDRYQFNPQLASEAEKAMGQHTISLTGVPKDSRYSQVLVAADHRMKRLAMGLEASNAPNLPSVLEMAKRANASRMRGAPRMWMECNYQPVATDESGTVWKLDGQGVKALTENAMFDRDGKSKVVDKQNKFAQKWADNLTERFEDVAKVEPVFRDLRNVMDMSVIAAIIKRNRIIEKMGLDLTAITTDMVKMPSRPVPSSVPTQCSFVSIRNNYVVTTSGGVQVDSWAVAANTKIDNTLLDSSVAALASNQNPNWWWNAE